MEWQKVEDELSKMLRLRTYPVSVKYLSDLSDRSIRALKLEEPLNACQVVSLVRHEGIPRYFTAEDTACIVGAVCLGLCPMPEHMADGTVASFLYKDLDSACKHVETLPKIKYGEVKSVVCAPLHRTTFEPDQIIIYGNSAQIMRIIQAYLWNKGGRIAISLGGEAGLCGGVMAECYNKKTLSLALPCYGDRMTSMAMDDELETAIPANEITDVMEGLRSTATVVSYPTQFGGINITPTYMPDYFLTEAAMKRKTK